ncbi:OsmC family protein [Mycobacterium sp. SMC-2]|uniref:OsmC family protein n=1 Tax=Mycobacterium sp. SMC-2 TaxID=2857058 RepID=UPI0021B1AB97|nr:OsmC family protein [Mycobacterium sp. SMC-2]UXA08080.1 OsmC family protein [Mycobacterium sp. SMC-2]
MYATTTINGLDVAQIAGTIDAVTANPPLARFQFRARHEWIDGSHSRTTIKDFYGVGQEDASRTAPFTVDSDEPPVLLGENRAPNASEYVLHALASCLTGTIVFHAAARGIALEGLEATIQGDLDAQGVLGLNDSVRPGYEKIRVTIEATGDVDDNQLAELASLTRYSPVLDLVSNPVPVAIDLVRA